MPETKTEIKAFNCPHTKEKEGIYIKYVDGVPTEINCSCYVSPDGKCSTKVSEARKDFNPWLGEKPCTCIFLTQDLYQAHEIPTGKWQSLRIEPPPKQPFHSY